MYILFYKSYAHNNSLSSQNKGSFPINIAWLLPWSKSMIRSSKNIEPQGPQKARKPKENPKNPISESFSFR